MKNYTLLDGGVGTSLWEKASDHVPVWRYNIENPAIVRELHREMAAAGAEVVLSNTFGANRTAMKNTNYQVTEVVTQALTIAHEELDGKVKIAMGVGPLMDLIEPYGDLSEDECFEIYNEMFRAAKALAPDYIYLQTFIDLNMLCIAAKAAAQYDIPLLCSMSFSAMKPGTVPHTVFGDTPESLVRRLLEFHPEAIGINCGMGPEDALDVIRYFSEHVSGIPLIFKPNAGKPNANGISEFDRTTFAVDVAKAAQIPGVCYIGGCCGVNADYIGALKAQLEKHA